MSESLPYSGVTIVAVMRYAVVAHACSSRPLRSSAMVRIADATIVWSRAARNMPIIRPTRIVRICRWVSGPSVAAGAVAAMSVLRGVGGGFSGGGGCRLVGAAAADRLRASGLQRGGEALEVAGERGGLCVGPV